MGSFKIVIAIALALSTLGAALPTATSSVENLKPEARDESNSQEDEFVPSGYVLPNQIFNDGKPFYVGKDPVSGQLDFSSKKAGFETSANEVYDPKEKIVLSSSAPNFHDFLNLPVKYSSSKFVYPLVSSSYANLKYQGNNKNFIAKKAPTVAPTIKSTTTSPHYYNIQRNTTKLQIATTQKPSTTTPRAKTTVGTTTTTVAPPKTYTTRRPFPSTTPYTVPTTTTTRKKFVPTKKYSQTSSAEPTSSEEIRKSTKSETKPTQKTTTPLPTTKRMSTTTAPKTTQKATPSSTTTRKTTPQASIFPTDPTTVKNPVVFSESPSLPSFSPMPTTTIIPILDAGEVYHSVGQKHEPSSMSLAEIFNVLAEEEEVNALSAGNSGNQGLDAHGNLMRPISPSRPSPFSMQQATTVSPSTTRLPSSSNQPRQPLPLQTTLTIHPSQQTQQNKLNAEKLAQSGNTFNGEYVQYQVQQPNVMQYHPTSNINNVVISPGQHSATFVLGSQQTVGANSFLGSVEKEPLFSKEPPVQYGTVINENINAAYPQGNANKNNINFQQIGNEEQTQELLVSSNIRFPANEEQPNDNVAAANAVNGHAQPLTMHLQLQQAGNQVVFPKPEDSAGGYSIITPNTQANEIQYNNENPGDVQIQKHEVLTLNQHHLTQKPNPSPVDLHSHIQPQGQQERPQQMSFQAYPQQSEGLRPVQHMEPPHFHSRPPPEYHEQPSRSPIHNRPPYPHGLHGPNGLNGPNSFNGPNGPSGPNGPNGPPGPPPPAYMYNEFTRKPIAGMNRPNPDRTLPNILPQFRPNAKLSQGHPTGFSQEPGNIRIQHPQFQKRPGSPQFAHRRQPIVGRYPVTRGPEYLGGPPPPQEANRRIYRVSPYPPQFVDRNYLRRPQQLPQLQKPLESYGYERHSVYKTIPDPYQPRPEPPSGPATERLAAFEEEDLVINDPPQPVINMDDKEEVKLEPVVTLQMLKSQQKSSEESGEIKVSGESSSAFEKTGPNQGLYVVYPVKPSLTAADLDINVSAETKEPAPVDAQLESGTSTAAGNDYQNTPFSVIRDQPQEPILVVKNKVHTLQQKQAKDKFPYPLEKPDPSYTGFGHKYHTDVDRLDRDTGTLIAPRIVHGAYAPNAGTETPIAIAYTPTEPNRFHGAGLHYQQDKFSTINLATPVIREIRDSQTEDTINQDLDTRGQNFEKDFMAPFYPSMSLDTATSSPIASNGWNVYHGTTERLQSLYEKNNINRADVSSISAATSEEEESTTKAFELDRFQPELQGGFKPIYPPGYKHDDDFEADHSDKSANDRPLALALTRVEPRTASPTKPSTTTTLTTSYHTTITTTTPRPITITTTPKPTPQALTATSPATPELTPATTPSPTPSTPKPTQRKKTPFETSLEALLFGDDEDFEDDPPLKDDEAKRS